MKHFLISVIALFSITANACGLATPIKISPDYVFSNVKVYPPLDRYMLPMFYDRNAPVTLRIGSDSNVLSASLKQGGIFGPYNSFHPERIRREIINTKFGQTHITKIMDYENNFAEEVSTIIVENGFIVSIKIEENNEVWNSRFQEFEINNESTCVISATLK